MFRQKIVAHIKRLDLDAADIHRIAVGPFLVVGLEHVVNSCVIGNKHLVRAKTVAHLNKMEIALEQYFQDWGHYPEHTSTRKVTWPRSEFASPQSKVYLDNYQPYANESSGFRDAWGNPFYYSYPGIMNEDSYDLWSMGKDEHPGEKGVNDDGAGTADDTVAEAQTAAADNSDDITNWKRY